MKITFRNQLEFISSRSPYHCSSSNRRGRQELSFSLIDPMGCMYDPDLFLAFSAGESYYDCTVLSRSYLSDRRAGKDWSVLIRLLLRFLLILSEDSILVSYWEVRGCWGDDKREGDVF